MRKIQLLRETVPTRTRWLLCLLAAMSVVLGLTVSFGGGNSAQASVNLTRRHHSLSPNSVAPAPIPDYSGGRYLAADPNGGYWTVNWAGAVTANVGAPTFGSPALSAVHLNKPIAGIAATPDGEGYWLVGSDGGVFSYGDAKFYGSTGGIHLNKSIAGIAATPDGEGYWLVGTDGGIFSFGDAKFYGSTGNLHLNEPIVGMAVTGDGEGYWLVASDGGIFTFGDAKFYGSTGAVPLNQPIVGMAPTPDGAGYWLVASDGGIFTYGDAKFYGTLGTNAGGVIGIVVNPPVAGYTLVQADGTAAVPSLTPAPAPAAKPTPPPAPTTTTTGAPRQVARPITRPTAPPKPPTTTTKPPSTTTTSGANGAIATQCPCTTAPAMPAAAPSGYNRIFTEDFNTNAPVGDFDNVYGSEFGEYTGGPIPQADGSEAEYEPNEVLSAANGSMYYDLHTDSSGTPVVAAPQPMNQQGFEYGQVGMAIRMDSETGPQNYKIAFLMWPTTGAWTNEVDFAETQPSFGDDISVNSLLSNDSPNFDMTDGNQDTGVNLNDGKYHTFLVNWTPTSLTVSIDGVVKATFPASSGADPAQAMRVSLQAEGWIPGGNAAIDPSSTATVEVPYIYINQWN
jgi:hypothetical protein